MSTEYRIVIVDDELDGLQFHIEELTREKYRVVRIDQPDEALRFCGFQDADIHLLVLDMMFPVPAGVPAHLVQNGRRTGGHLLNVFRKWNQRTPVLILSHLTEKELLEEALIQYRALAPDGAWIPTDSHSATDQADHLQGKFRVWVREKRRIKPEDLPSVARRIIRDAAAAR